MFIIRRIAVSMLMGAVGWALLYGYRSGIGPRVAPLAIWVTASVITWLLLGPLVKQASVIRTLLVGIASTVVGATVLICLNLAILHRALWGMGDFNFKKWWEVVVFAGLGVGMTWQVSIPVGIATSFLMRWVSTTKGQTSTPRPRKPVAQSTDRLAGSEPSNSYKAPGCQ